MTPNGAVPVEALLKISLDKAGAQGIRDFLDQQEHSFTRIEKLGARISDHFSGLTRAGMGLAGVAGVGAVINKLIGNAQQGGMLGLAAGHVTGGAGVGWSYGGAMLQAQGRTGVPAGDIAQGLIMAIQQAGGSPSPQQAAVLGGLLAGYGQTVGMSPSQVAGVIGPLLQASNRQLTAGNLLGMGATLSQGLTNFPGSQAAPMLGLLSNIGVSQAIGAGPHGGFMPNMGGLVAAVNVAAGTNSIWRNPSITGGAISGISGGLQNAYGNPAMEAFLQRAGVNYWDQRKGFTPQNMEAISREATSMYGSGITRDLALRSMFGLQGADMLEQFTPGSHADQALQWALKHPHHPDARKLLGAIGDAQLGHTPQSDLNKLEAKILQLIHQHPIAAGAAGLGLWKGKGLVGKGLKGAGRGLSKLFRRGGGGTPGAPDSWGEAEGSLGADAGAEGGGASLGEILGSLGLRVGGGVLGAFGAAMLFPDSAGGAADHFTNKQAEAGAVRNVLRMAAHKFGANVHGTAARNWMQQQLYHQLGASGPWGAAGVEKYGGHPPTTQAGQMLDQVLGIHWGGDKALVNGKQPAQAFSDATTTLQKAADELLNIARRGGTSSFSSYQPGGWMGASGVQSIGAMAPGVEFASLVGAGSNGAAFAAFTGGAVNPATGGGSTVAASFNLGPATGQSCMLTWYDPALGGDNSYSGNPEPNGPTASGVPYSPTKYTCAAPPNYDFGTKIEFTVGGKSIVCVVTDRGGAIQGSHFDLSRAAFTALGSLSAGVLHGSFRVVGKGSASANGGPVGSGGGSGGSGGGGKVLVAADRGGSGAAGAHGAAAAGATAATAHHHAHHPQHHPAPVHVHVHVDGREIRNHRVMLGHHR